jgi:hypothetical protein
VLNSIIVQQLHRYAHIYIDTQQRFHGIYADKILIGRGLKLSGNLPYWDIEVDSAAIEIIGELKDSSLMTGAGKLRIFCHYLDRRVSDALRGCYGTPAGKMLGRMTNSGRTVMVFPDQESPFMLKFSGDFFPPELGFNSTLAARNIRQAVENFTQQRTNPYLTPEPVGIVVSTAKLAFLQRALPVPSDHEIESDDVLLGTQVVFSDAFAATNLGNHIFSRLGTKDAWLEYIFAPKIGALIDDSLQRRIAHLELHPQNLDILIDTRTGNIRHLFVKDLEDMYQDPVALAAIGQYPQALHITRDQLFGVLGEYHSKYSLDRFYWEFLGQTTGYKKGLMQNTITDVLKETAYQRYQGQDLTAYPEYTKLQGDSQTDLFDIIAALRDLDVKINLSQHFQRNESARDDLTASSGLVISTSKLKAFTFTPALPNLEFGYVDQIPVAISRDVNGSIEHYYFKF